MKQGWGRKKTTGALVLQPHGADAEDIQPVERENPGGGWEWRWQRLVRTVAEMV